MNVKEYLLYSLIGFGIIAVLGYFFYRSYCAILLMLPFVLIYIRYKKQELGEKRRSQLMLQFKETLVSVNGSVQAGLSLENAFCCALNEMREFYGEKSDIVRELSSIKSGLSNNRQITALLADFGRRSGISDINDFASLLSIGKRSGGNIGRIMNSYITVVEEKVSVMQEIDTMISAKKYEQRVMNMVPFFIILYVDMTSKGFFDVLYHNVAGVVIMSIALALYIASIYLAKRISDIKV